MNTKDISHKLLFRKAKLINKRIVFLFLIICFTVVSCETTVQHREKVEVINSGVISIKPILNTKQHLSFIFNTDYNIIELSSNKEEGLIGNIDKIRFACNKIFVLDRDKTKSLFIFSNKGNFITKISNHGEGPGQYKELGDFLINTKREEIYLLNSYPAKVLIYNFDGKFLSEKRISNYAWQFEFNKDSILFLYSFNMISNEDIYCDLLSYNDEMDITNSWFPIDFEDQTKFVEMPSNFNRFGDSLSFIRPFTDTVFDLSSGDLKVKYVFDFGKHSIPPGFFKNDNFRSEIPTFFKKAQKLINENKYVSNIQPFFESEHFFYMMYRYQNDSYHNIYFKKDAKLYTFNHVENDIIPVRFGRVIKVENDRLVTMIEAIDFKNDIAEFYNQLSDSQKKTFFHDNKKLVNTALNIKNSDNPVLLLYSLKSK